MRISSATDSDRTGMKPLTRAKGKGQDPAVIEEAKAIAADYRLTLDRNANGMYQGSSIEVPTALGFGCTPDECVAETLKSVIAIVAQVLADGGIPPASSRENKRDQQVNVRLSVHEKACLDAVARTVGFRSVPDLLRHIALSHVADGTLSSGRRARTRSKRNR